MIWFLLATLVFCGYVLYRNWEVYEYRLSVLEVVSSKAQTDIDYGREWKWRYKELDKVTYDEMMFKFWKPIDSFYEDKKFLE